MPKPWTNADNEEIRNAKKFTAGYVGEALLEAAQRGCTGVHQADTIYDGLHTQGGDDGGTWK